MTRKWNIVIYQLIRNYDAGNEVFYSTKVFKFKLHVFGDSYILVYGDITSIGHQLKKSSI